MDRKKIDNLAGLPLMELVAIADKLRQKHIGSNLSLCSILNAKSGLCNQDCKFCAQAARHKTGIKTYPLVTKKEMLLAARKAKDTGAQRFGIVTSGDALSAQELNTIADAINDITSKLKMKACASLGSMKQDDFSLLKSAGLSRYHHNIETSERYFPEIVTAHSFRDRVETIKLAKLSGLEVCSGGIIGMGETMKDRIDMALTLKELNVDSVPINILVAVKGTALKVAKAISCGDVIRTIALFRVILEDKIIKVAAGRESLLNDFQALAFMAGANGMLIGGYLTVQGRDPARDKQLIKEIRRVWART